MDVLAETVFVEDARSGKKDSKSNKHVATDAENLQRRFEACKTSWSIMESRLQSVVKDQLEAVFQSIAEFVSSAYAEPQNGQSITSYELPAAVVFGGINASAERGDKGVFESLAEYLQSQEQCFAAILRSSSCTSMHATMASIHSQIRGAEQAVVGAEGDEELNEAEEAAPEVQGGCDLDSLAAWYRKECRRIDNNDNVRPVTLIIENLESFSSLVIQDLLTSCSQHQGLPLVFIFNMATSAVSLSRRLPGSLSLLLRTKYFSFPRPSQHLDALIKQLFIDGDTPIVFGPTFWRFLVDSFETQTLSIQYLINSLKMGWLEHYLNVPLSFMVPPLLDSSSKALVQKLCSTLTHDDLERVRALSSIQSCSSPQKAGFVPIDDQSLRHSVHTWMTRMLSHMTRFRTVMKCWSAASTLLRLQPVCLRETYMDYIGDSLSSSETFGRINRAIQRITTAPNAIETAKTLINDWTAILSKESIFSGDVSRLEALLKQVNEQGQSSALTLTTSSSQEESALKPDGPITPLTKTQPPKTSSSSSSGWSDAKRRRLALCQPIGTNNAQQLSVVDDLAMFFQSLTTTHLPPISLLPLSEIFVFNNARSVREVLHPGARSSTEAQLLHPQQYLRCSCCENDNESAMLDISMAYRLSHQMERLVSLPDWFNAFTGLVGSHVSFKERQARFTRAKESLQHVGLLKATSKRQDHMEKLVFSLAS
mmetsp:Transcript_5383/g.8358  ORF Transcript_5383/g.8358 Transcript_5383/m.8358 type:complete len:709 (+) Transcript_5383:35-2161(+)